MINSATECTIELRAVDEIMGPLHCDVIYLGGQLSGFPGCRWAVVVGYIANAWSMDCYGFSVKPTKRQIRKLKKMYR